MSLPHQAAPRHRRTACRRDRALAGRRDGALGGRRDRAKADRRDRAKARHHGGRRRAVVALVVGAALLSGAAVAMDGPSPGEAVPFTAADAGPAPTSQLPEPAPSLGHVAAEPERLRPGGPSSTTGTVLDRGHLRLRGSAPSAAFSQPGRGPVVQAAAVLRAWDRRRAGAWAEGDVRALRRLYVDRAGVADVRLLRRYADRGYRVEGLTTQLLAVDVLEQRPGWWLLRVTDRLAGAVAVRGAERVPLPRDGVDTHVVALVRGVAGRWRVAEVRAA